MTDSSIDSELNLRLARRRMRQPASGTSVLYDAPGPRTLRRTRISSVVAVAVVAVLAWAFVYRPLAAEGQFTMELWGPYVDPTNESFGPLWKRIFEVGVVGTLKAAGLAIVSSLAFGLVLAVVRVELKSLQQRRYTHLARPVASLVRAGTWGLNGLTRVCVEVLRGMPVVITVFFVARGLPELGLPAREVLWYLVIGLTLYNGIVIAEIVRSGMEGLPKGQREAAASLGLSSWQTTVLVLLPQAVRIMLPAIISQLVVVLKDTSLGFIIVYPDLLNVGKNVLALLHNPLQTYFVIGLLYLTFNYALSRLADWTQRRLSRARA
jgi:glutamate transport system permease protein